MLSYVYEFFSFTLHYDFWTTFERFLNVYVNIQNFGEKIAHLVNDINF